MITQIRGVLKRLNDTEAFIEVGHFEYHVYVPEFVVRQLKAHLNGEVQLRTIEYIEGNPQKGRLTPRLIGFMSDAEREFFDIICSVDGVGVKKALKAIVRPVREVAIAIEEQNIKELSTLPGIGPAAAERIVAKLRRKMTKFALMVTHEGEETPQEMSVAQETLEALISLGHAPNEARERVERVMDAHPKVKSVEELLTLIYQAEHQ